MGGGTLRRALWASCVAALACAQLVASHVQDRASWQQAHVGRVTHASLAGQRAYVTTAQGVVACLTLRTGEIGARPCLP
jgi:hypothetical protein